MKGVVVSGMRPTGALHLGNLFGALDKWRTLQQDYQCFYFIADWHALTTDYDETEDLKKNIKEIALDWLASGLDPEKCTLFIQSQVPEHAILNTLLSMITPLSWLERNPSYKEQQEELKNKDLQTFGFLGYPVLQAADILIYKGNYVPVGVDQLPHLEITREIARRFNFIYRKRIFPEPEALLAEVQKLPGTDGRKMSKSYNNAVYISDPPEVVEAKVMQMFTDPQRIKRTDPGRPWLCPVFAYHKLFSPGQMVKEVDVACRTAAIGCVECKGWMAKNLNAYLQPIRERRQKFEKSGEKVIEIFLEGSRSARKIAMETLEEVKEAMKIDIAS